METLKINGMSCNHCTSSVQKALESIPELSSIVVNLGKGRATFENTGASREDIRSAISKIGFEPGE